MESIEEMTAILVDEGYSNIRYIEGVGYCGLHPYLYTWGLCWTLDEVGYAGRFCFSDLCSALGFLESWDGATYPVIGEDGCTAIKGSLKTSPDHGNTVAGAWGSYAEQVMPADAGEVQTTECRRAFYGGAVAMFRLLAMNQAPTEEEALAHIERVHLELSTYAGSIAVDPDSAQ